MPLNFNNSPKFSVDTKSATNNIGAATLTMWVYPTASASDVYLDFSVGTGIVSRFEFLWDGSKWQIGGRALDGDGFSSINTGAMANYTNNWHFCTTSMDFTNAQGYIDVYDAPNGLTTASGAFGSMTAGNTSATNSVGSYIGCQASGGGNEISAYLDDICFYTRLLSANEKEDMYYKKKKPESYQLVHRWRLREKHPGSNASTLIDEGSIGSGTTITGTLAYVEGILP